MFITLKIGAYQTIKTDGDLLTLFVTEIEKSIIIKKSMLNKTKKLIKFPVNFNIFTGNLKS